MRVTFSAQAQSSNRHSSFHVPVMVRLNPSRGMAGEHTYASDSYELRRLLRRTDLSAVSIEQFLDDVTSGAKARLCGVELSEATLKQVGYFVD